MSVFFGVVGLAAAATAVTGTAEVGQTLTAQPTTPADPVNWYTCGNETGTPLATSTDTYTLQPTDFNTYVCAEDMVDTTESAPTGPITEAPVNSSPPTLSTQAPQDGHAISVSDGTWSPTPTGYAYQWYRCGSGCSAISGATGSSYSPTANDVGSTLAATVTAYDGPSPSASPATAGPTSGAVLPLPPANTAVPTISGSALQGQKLTASPGAWSDSPTQYDYQWQLCAIVCTPIAGATASTYRLSDADVGTSLAVSVTATNAGGTSAAATSAHTAIVTAATTTGLLTSTGSALVNQPVTLDAIVTSSADTASPDGTVEFDSGGSPIPGCGAQAVAGTGQSVMVSCSASFGVSSPSLTATFTPASDAPLRGSASSAVSITVAANHSVTTLDVPSSLQRGASVTYTASVSPALDLTGPVIPSGTVRFTDRGKTIGGCAQVSLTNGGATCTTRYRSAGRQLIRASYNGDASFAGSLSRTRTVSVISRLPRLRGHRRPLGSITATMQWTFHYTPSYTRVLALALHGLGAHSQVTVTCAGRGCPFHSHTVASRHATLDLEHGFHRRRLRLHARLVVTVTRSRFVGEYYRFTVRPRRQPSVLISCLAPGSDRPGVGCKR